MQVIQEFYIPEDRGAQFLLRFVQKSVASNLIKVS